MNDRYLSLPLKNEIAPFQTINQIEVFTKLSALSPHEGHSELPFWGHIAPHTKFGRYPSQDSEPLNKLLVHSDVPGKGQFRHRKSKTTSTYGKTPHEQTSIRTTWHRIWNRSRECQIVLSTLFSQLLFVKPANSPAIKPDVCVKACMFRR